jgi:hypothetical protein
MRPPFLIENVHLLLSDENHDMEKVVFEEGSLNQECFCYGFLPVDVILLSIDHPDCEEDPELNGTIWN